MTNDGLMFLIYILFGANLIWMFIAFHVMEGHKSLSTAVNFVNEKIYQLESDLIDMQRRRHRDGQE